MLKFLQILSFFASTTFLIANEAETEPATAQTKVYKVKDGRVSVEGIEYPVFARVAQVDPSSYGGIRYDISGKNSAAALKLAKKIKAFYKGKSIGGAKLSKFKKFGSPQRQAWYASGKAKGKQRGVAVIVNDREVRVEVMPDFSSETLTLML